MQDFVHLHVHSQYSILDGQAAIKKLVDKAIADGMKGIAVTDHGNMMGIKEFYNYVSKVNKGKAPEEMFKPIIGCELYIAPRRLQDKETKDDRGYHLILLAKNAVVAEMDQPLIARPAVKQPGEFRDRALDHIALVAAQGGVKALHKIHRAVDNGVDYAGMAVPSAGLGVCPLEAHDHIVNIPGAVPAHMVQCLLQGKLRGWVGSDMIARVGHAQSAVIVVLLVAVLDHQNLVDAHIIELVAGHQAAEAGKALFSGRVQASHIALSCAADDLLLLGQRRGLLRLIGKGRNRQRRQRKHQRQKHPYSFHSSTTFLIKN